MSASTTPEQTSNQHPTEDGRMVFSVGINELLAARHFMDYFTGATPGLVLSACALDARMVAHDGNGMYIQRLRPIQIRGWDSQDTVVVVPIKLIDMAFAYEAKLSAKGERCFSVQIHVTPGMPNPLGQFDHALRRQVEIEIAHRTFTDRETICRIPHFERNIPRAEDETTQVEYSYLNHKRIQQAHKLITGKPESPAIKAHGEKAGIVTVNEYVLLVVMPMLKAAPGLTPEWAYLQATPRFEVAPQPPVQFGKTWDQKFADSAPADVVGAHALAQLQEHALNDAAARTTSVQ